MQARSLRERVARIWYARRVRARFDSFRISITCANYSSHTSGVRESGKIANQGCRCAPPLAIVRAAFQAALGTLEACQEGSLACEQSEQRQVIVFLKTAPRQGCEDWGII